MRTGKEAADIQRQNKALQLLREKSGASFMFVLGVMLFLMMLGVSALVASGANVGFVEKQRTHNQLMILADSVQKTILASLNSSTSDMSEKLVMAIYSANDHDPDSDPDINPPPDKLESIKLNMEIEGYDLADRHISVETITLYFPTQEVIIKPRVDAIEAPESVDGQPVPAAVDGRPKTATVNATMNVTVELNVNGRAMTSAAVYEYSGGVLYENSPNNMVFAVDGEGEWSLIKHEKLDS